MQQVVKSRAFIHLIMKRRIKRYAYKLHYQSFLRILCSSSPILQNRFDQKLLPLTKPKDNEPRSLLLSAC